MTRDLGRLKVLQVSRSDNRGYRFNGVYAAPFLSDHGIDSRHLVWERNLDKKNVSTLLPFWGVRPLMRRLAQKEYENSLQSTLYFYTYGLPLHRTFRSANVVHYHLINDGYFSITALPFLSGLKPTIWTWHDPWMMTGHCIYPMTCGRWQTGCGACPDLASPFAMRHDRTSETFDGKQAIMRKSNINIIVASRWMERMMGNSPIARHIRPHYIPFGVDLDTYKPGDTAAARKRLGILDDHVVVFVRAASGPYKGTDDIVNAIDALRTTRKICILSVQEVGTFNRFIGTRQIVELGWIDDDDLMVAAHTAADFFIMPSKAEAFGLMAVEAMACGKPVIVCEGTSLPEVTFAPDAGIAVPQNDVPALTAAISRLIDDAGECRARGDKSRELAIAHYDIRLHAQRMAGLYHAVTGRGSTAPTAN